VLMVELASSSARLIVSIDQRRAATTSTSSCNAPPSGPFAFPN
jgi:hypothetical protein